MRDKFNLINHFFVIIHASFMNEKLYEFIQMIEKSRDHLASHLISRKHNSRLWLPFSNQSNLSFRLFSRADRFKVLVLGASVES